MQNGEGKLRQSMPRGGAPLFCFYFGDCGPMVPATPAESCLGRCCAGVGSGRKALPRTITSETEKETYCVAGNEGRAPSAPSIKNPVSLN
jgi:hypothetical protein